MKFRSLVFDFDGTIADTFDEVLRIYNQLADEYKLRKIGDHEVHELRHMKLNDFLDHLGIPKRRVPMLRYRGTRMLKSSIPTIPLIKGMAAALPRLRKKAEHFGILTSNSVENVEYFLQTHGLDGVFTFISSTSKLTGKAKHLRAIRKNLSINPQEMIYIGDEIRDIKASKKGGVPISGVGWGFNSPDALDSTNPDYLFHHPSELIELVR